MISPVLNADIKWNVSHPLTNRACSALGFKTGLSDCDGKAARSLRAANLNLGIGWDRLGFSLWQESNFDEIKDCWRTHIELSLIGFTATADGLESMSINAQVPKSRPLASSAPLTDASAPMDNIITRSNIPLSMSTRAPWTVYFFAALGGLSIYAGSSQNVLLLLTNFWPLLAVPALPWALIGLGSVLLVLAIYRIAFHIALGYAASAIDDVGLLV